MNWLHIITVVALIVIGVVIYMNKRSNGVPSYSARYGYDDGRPQ